MASSSPQSDAHQPDEHVVNSQKASMKRMYTPGEMLICYCAELTDCHTVDGWKAPLQFSYIASGVFDQDVLSKKKTVTTRSLLDRSDGAEMIRFNLSDRLIDCSLAESNNRNTCIAKICRSVSKSISRQAGRIYSAAMKPRGKFSLRVQRTFDG